MCWDVCCGIGVENTTQYNYIYECYLVLFGKPEQTLGNSCMHVRGVYMICGVLLAWCLGFSWSIVHVKPRAYKLEQGTYHTILNIKTSKLICQTVALYTGNAGYIVYVDMDYMCRRHDM